MPRWHDRPMPPATACWRHSDELCCRNGKGADNSSPESTTDDSDPLDWTGSDKGNGQVCRATVTLITIMHTGQLCGDMLVTPSDVSAARNRQQGPFLQSRDRLLHVLLMSLVAYTHSHAGVC